MTDRQFERTRRAIRARDHFFNAVENGYLVNVWRGLEEGVGVNISMTEGNTALHVACRKGQDKVVELLITYQADLDKTNWDGDTALQIACREGHGKVAKLLIKKQADLNLTLKKGDTALHIACREGYYDIVELLLTQADLNFASVYGVTALHVQSGRGHDKVAELLIKNNADINVTNKDGDTALHVACRGGHDKVVELLIKNQADLNVTNKDGDTILHAACKEGHVKVVELLINNSADLNVTNKNGHTAVNVACSKRHIEVVELLFQNHADLNVTDENRDTLLYAACRGGYAEVVEELIQNHVDINVTYTNGDSALHVACREGHDKVVELLIESQADLNLGNSYGETALHIACKKCQYKAVELLIKSQADVNKTNKMGNTAVHEACRVGHAKVVELLIRNQADLNVTNKDGDTALHVACGQGHDNFAEQLIRRHAYINLANMRRVTGLHEACKEGRDMVAELLIENHADLNLINKYGDTALHVACRGGHDKVVELLIKNHADLNVINKDGDTATLLACREGLFKVMELLIRSQADLNVTDKDGDTGLHIAYRKRHDKVVELLIRNQADLNVTDKFGETVLLLACREGDDKVVELLIKNQADLNLTNTYYGDTVLHVACREGLDKVAELLIKSQQANLNLPNNKDRDTALHVACREGREKVVELLIESQADLNLTNKNGNTAVHEACRGGHDNVVELLIRHRADLLLTNENGQRPVDLTDGLDTSTRLLVETETRKQADYNELVSSLGSVEETTVKLFLCGDGQVGKTSLETILVKTGFFEGIVWNIRSFFRRQGVFNPTPGVNVSRKDVWGIGRLSLHDFAGQAQFYVTHAMLLRTTNAIFPVVYKITDREEEQKRQVHGWLTFINCSNPDPTYKPQIVLIASHADKLQDPTMKIGLRRAQAMVEHYGELFEESLVVSQEVFLMNCLKAGSTDIRRLRDVVANFKAEMLQGRQEVPKVCVQLMSDLTSWRKERQTFPVLQWQEYLTTVRKDTFTYLSERTVQLATSYLHDIGEIIYLRRNSLVVLSPQWLFTSVFGRLLAPEDFPILKLQRADKNCMYVTRQELIRVFSDIADIPQLTQLLQDFQLCHTYDNHTFILPSLLEQEMDEKAWSPVSSKSAVYFGIQICCRTEIDSFSCDLFPRLQTLLMQAHPDKLHRPLIWKNSAKCTDGKAEALLQMAKDKRWLNIFVRSNDGDREDCKLIMNLLTDMAYRLVHETSPGARSRDMILSALDLREHSSQPHAYSREEVGEAAEKGENLVHPQRNVPEKVKDLLLHLDGLKGILGTMARKRSQLVETLRHINPILDHLRQDDLINMEENDRIRAARTPQDAARELLNILEDKGKQACVRFHTALTKADPIAANLLEESPMSVEGPTVPVSSRRRKNGIFFLDHIDISRLSV